MQPRSPGEALDLANQERDDEARRHAEEVEEEEAVEAAVADERDDPPHLIGDNGYHLDADDADDLQVDANDPDELERDLRDQRDPPGDEHEVDAARDTEEGPGPEPVRVDHVQQPPADRVVPPHVPAEDRGYPRTFEGLGRLLHDPEFISSVPPPPEYEMVEYGTRLVPKVLLSLWKDGWLKDWPRG